jgi:lipopolysaccharide/colanic/teichoic acid biosynthesis glycosyltransferase
MPTSVVFIKRVMDIVLAIIGLLLTLPLYPFIALAIRLESKGPIFFKQKRVGRVTDTTTTYFNMAKFRSMRADAEKVSGPVWAVDDDPRITRVGRFLRKARLDELPQLFNVLVGQMSIVGPRPERPHFVEKLDQAIPFYNERVFHVKPGITGLAQIHCEYDTSEESVKTKLYYDHAYAARLTTFWEFLRADLEIMVKTVTVMFTGKGAK